MPSYVLFAFLALIFLASSSILFKFTARHKIKNSLVFYFYYCLVYLLLGLIFPIIKPIKFLPQDFIALRPVILASMVTFLGGFFFFSNLYKLDITTFAPLYNFRNIFSTILAILFLGETVAGGKIPWLLIIFIAGFLVNIDEKMKIQSFFSGATLGFLIYVFCLSIYSIFTNLGIANVGYWNFLFYTYVYSFILPLVFLLPKIYKNMKISLVQFWPVLLSTAFEFVGVTLFVRALSEKVIVPTIILSFPGSAVFTYLIARFKPEFLEHHTTKVYVIRFAGIFAMFIATLMLIYK